jgi:hypothetical protein
VAGKVLRDHVKAARAHHDVVDVEVVDGFEDLLARVANLDHFRDLKPRDYL